MKSTRTVVKDNVWIRKISSFEEGEEKDAEYYRHLTPEERLSVVQDLREEFDKFGMRTNYACAEGLRRAVRTLHQA